MNWDDLNEDKNKIDYWELLDKSDKHFIISSLQKLLDRDPSAKTISSWTIKHQKSLMQSYIDGLKNLREEAFRMTMQDFGMFVYIAIHITKDSTEIQKQVEPVPQSLNLQKELEELYTDENINKAINELGIFTDKKGGS